MFSDDVKIVQFLPSKHFFQRRHKKYLPKFTISTVKYAPLVMVRLRMSGKGICSVEYVPKYLCHSKSVLACGEGEVGVMNGQVLWRFQQEDGVPQPI